MIEIVLSIAALVLIWIWFVKPTSHWKNQGIKQSKPWPLIGDSWRLMPGKTAFLDYVSWMYEQSQGARYFGFYEFFIPAIVITDPELLKQIMVKAADSFSDHNHLSVDPEIDPYWGNSLFILKGQKWKHTRTLLSPSYTGSKLRISYELMAETADSFIDYFLSKSQDLIEIEMKDAFSRYTNDVIATTAFGIKIDSLKDRDNTFYYHGSKITNFQSLGSVTKILLLKFAPFTWKIFGLNLFGKEHVNYFHEVLFETIRQREEKNILRPDLINILMEAKRERENLSQNGHGKQTKAMSDEEILAQALIFFFAGFEAISRTLSFGAYELALNKEVQDKLRQEIRETHNQHGKPSFEVLQGMKYMDMVVSELLRKWPSFMITDRCVNKPFTIEPVNKKEVPVQLEPGTIVFIPIYRMQTDPRYFPNPENFDPERFSEENKHKIIPYTYLPFGGGPRFCIGNRFALLEIKCLLFNILLNFEILPTKKTQSTPKIRSPSFQYTMDGGFWLGLKRIKPERNLHSCS